MESAVSLCVYTTMDELNKYEKAPDKYIYFIGVSYRGADKYLARPD